MYWQESTPRERGIPIAKSPATLSVTESTPRERGIPCFVQRVKDATGGINPA